MLNKKSRNWYESLIREITSLFNHDDFVSDKALSGEFLLGYHCQQKDFWDGFAERSRRPPLDEVNSLLSFVYTLLAHDIRSALETVGLDPAAGSLRP
jgi:CRISPR/Cas system-associated endonuclease Cas1